MKHILTFIFLALFTLNVQADQNFNVNNGFCHFVTPTGFANGSDDAETFLMNCKNATVTQALDGTGHGSVTAYVKYPDGAIPFTETFTTTGEESGIECLMTDSNGTQYLTRDWTSTYYVHLKKSNKRKHKRPNRDAITFETICRNGAQQ